MRRNPLLRRPLAALLTSTILVGLSATSASAHVGLTRTKINANEAQTLAFRAPVERDNATNARLEALAPAEFTIEQCHVPAGWTCDLSVQSDGTMITWDAITVGSPQDLRFEFDVVAPSDLGEYLFPAVQTYSDGHEAAWINPQADSDNPAPRIEVVAPDAEVAETEAPPPTHGGDDPEPSQEPTSNEGPDEPASTEPTDAGSESEPTDSSSSAPEAGGEETDEPSGEGDSTTAPGVVATDGTPDTVSLEDVANEGGSGSGLIIAVIALALAGAGGFVFLRSRA